MAPNNLTKKNFLAARHSIQTIARPLELARFQYAFDNGSVESVFRALGKFQNEDGGFGHALEPDFRAKASSALCTTIAFQIIRTTHTKPDESLIAKGLSFLLRSMNPHHFYWQIIPKLTEQAAHAPWWNQTNDETTVNSFSLNPTAEILGYLYDYQELVPGSILSAISSKVTEHILNLDKIEMHDLLCCVRLLQTEKLPKSLYNAIFPKLSLLIKHAVEYDPAKWKGYSLRPLQVSDNPNAPFFSEMETSVLANLDYEIEGQHADGSWIPTWSWGDAFPNEWALACREWTGIMTLDKLLTLKRFQRIEDIA